LGVREGSEVIDRYGSTHPLASRCGEWELPCGCLQASRLSGRGQDNGTARLARRSDHRSRREVAARCESLGWIAKVPSPGRGADPALALGILGGSGLAAYFGIVDVAKPQPGETVVVSAAAGSVGSIAGQIAKIRGARRRYRWGKDKLDQLIDLGFDVAIDRRAPDFATRIRQACRDGIDVYFYNVQGVVLDTCLEFLAKGGRVAMCGGVSALNENGGRARYNLMRVVWKRQGFSIFEHSDAYARKHSNNCRNGSINAGSALSRKTDMASWNYPRRSLTFSVAEVWDGKSFGAIGPTGRNRTRPAVDPPARASFDRSRARAG
jgi:Zinc-binding dehydrogenase